MSGRLTIKKFKELKKDKDYAIPCRRKDGREDYITITVAYDERFKSDVAYINNRFMGACLKRIKDNRNWFFIE